jgi:hypothetical protein
MLGLSLLLLLFGGIALDFWRGLAMQREMAAVADSAAIAAASGIDEEVYRATGEVLLDKGRARDLAVESVARQDSDVGFVSVWFDTDTQVTVRVTGEMTMGLLGVFVDDDDPITVAASATASPRLVP